MSDRRLTIAIVIAVIVVVGSLLARQFLQQEQTPVATVQAPAVETEEKRRTHVTVQLTDCSQNGDRVVATGYAKNTGNADLSYVTVKVIWMNKQGLVIEENEMFALSNQVLKPGDSHEFTDVTERTTAKQCNVEAIDWW